MVTDSTPAYAGFGNGKTGQAYNQAAFRYFLAGDRLRAQRSKRFVTLVLASLREAPGRNAQLTQHTAALVFAGLAAGVREVDFVGWFHEGRVAGAVLTHGVGAADEHAAVSHRIVTILKAALPANRAKDLHVRAIRFGRERLR